MTEFKGGPGGTAVGRAGGHRDRRAVRRSQADAAASSSSGSGPTPDWSRSTSRTIRPGYMITDDRMMTSIPGLFAAGDVRAQLTRQITTAVGDATTAAIAVEKYLTERRDTASRRRPRSVSDLEVVSLPNGQLSAELLSGRRPPDPRGGDHRSRRGARRCSSPSSTPAPGRCAAIWLTHAHVDHIIGVGRGEAGHRRPDPPPSARPRASTTRCRSSAPGSARSSRRPPPPDVALRGRRPASGRRVRVRGAASPRAIRPAA